MTRIRFGLVGTGHWAREVHAAGLGAHPDLDLIGVWGRDRERATAAAEPHGALGYDDFDALLNEVDALAFAVPPHVQVEMALRAAEAGKHLLLEKPVSTDPTTSDRLVEAVDARGLSTVVFFTGRFVPVWESWLEAIAGSGPLGGRADWMSSHLGPNNPYAGSQWRRESGALWDVGPHMVSQLITALGPVTDVAGVRGTGDLVHLVFTHEGGTTSRMSLSLTMPPEAVRVGVEFYGENGWMVQPDVERDLGQAYATALDELLANISTGETNHRCDVRFGRDVVDVLARCEIALDTAN